VPPRSWLRALPALAAAALLCVAATAPPPSVGPFPPPPCGTFTESGGGDSTVRFQGGDAVLQPLPLGLPAAACSVRVVASGWTNVNVALWEWDPVTLAPAAGTIALRTAFLDPSRMLYYTSNSVPWTVFEPALVTRGVAGVAECPRLTTALEVRSSSWSGGLKASYEPEGTPSMPAAVVVRAGGAPDGLQGSHPVLAHAICDGGPDLQSLRVVQAVRRTDVKLVEQPAELLQRFRVPGRAELSWVELAVDSVGGARTIPPPAVIAIVDADGLADPPAVMPPALIEATFEGYYEFEAYYEPAPRWASHLDFDHTITLEPEHDYWLYVRSAKGYRFRGRALTGEESPAFKWGIGAFYTRAIGNEPWTQSPAQALSFVLIGQPAPALVSVPPRGGGIDLRVAPNPTPGIADVSWSGAVGPVRFEVFDARGRRVATNAGGAAGAWRWEAKGSRGEPLPAGVYFVHARDSQGTRAMGRAVVVR